LAAAVKYAFGIETDLIEGHNGIFEVKLKDKVIYDKMSMGGDFPTHEQIAKSITDNGGIQVHDIPPSNVDAKCACA